jgi:hypothetical protein
MTVPLCRCTLLIKEIDYGDVRQDRYTAVGGKSGAGP